jgi:hypothetical protein
LRREVRHEGIDLRWSFAPLCRLGELIGCQITPHQVAAASELGRNRTNASTSIPQLYNLLVARIAPLTALLVSLLGSRHGLLGGSVRLHFSHCIGCDARRIISRWSRDGMQYLLMARKQTLNRLAQVLEQMEAVSDLDGIWCATPRSIRIGSSPIATDDRDARMILQPLGETVRRAVGQEVDRSVTLQVDDNRSIRMPTSVGPVINTDDLRRW